MSDIVLNDPTRSAVLDPAHLGDIEGALGTIRQGDTTRRGGWKARLATLLAIVGPGLIVMIGDNDAGAFSTYSSRVTSSTNASPRASWRTKRRIW